MKQFLNRKTVIFIVALVLIVGAILYFESKKPTTASPKAGAVVTRVPKQTADEPAKDISTPDGFINTSAITIQELIGKKVILVDFWTYSCINCQRTQPYLNAWYEKYKDQGLEIIGMHTPEFEFESHYENVLAAVKKANIKYPVVLDNDYSTWKAYQNRFWPRKYLIDIDGYIVYDHIGEGGYDETEKKIQELLKQRMAVLGQQGAIASDMAKPKDTVTLDFSQEVTPELYLGSARNQESKEYVTLQGDWEVNQEFATALRTPAKIILKYRAKNVYIVAGSDNPITVSIKRDGKVIAPSLVIKTHTLYPLVQDAEYGQHELEIIINQPGLEAFTFTFG